MLPIALHQVSNRAVVVFPEKCQTGKACNVEATKLEPKRQNICFGQGTFTMAIIHPIAPKDHVHASKYTHTHMPNKHMTR